MQPVRKGRKWSTRGSVPSFDSDSLQQLAFPDDNGANDSGPAKEDTSHVARRRLPSEPAHELDVGEVDLVEDAPIALIHVKDAEHTKSAIALTPRLEEDARDSGSDIVIDDFIAESFKDESFKDQSRPTVEPSSLAPLSMDATDARRIEVTKAPFDLPLAPPGEMRRRRPRSYGLLIACSLIATVVTAGVVVRRGTHEAAVSVAAASRAIAAPVETPKADVEVAPAAPAPIAPIAHATPLPPPPHPVTPAATTGTVTGLSDHRLWIDGALVPGFEATVRCGKHQVQVGSAGSVRSIDVPCGDAVKVQP